MKDLKIEEWRLKSTVDNWMPLEWPGAYGRVFFGEYPGYEGAIPLVLIPIFTYRNPEKYPYLAVKPQFF